MSIFTQVVLGTLFFGGAATYVAFAQDAPAKPECTTEGMTSSAGPHSLGTSITVCGDEKVSIDILIQSPRPGQEGSAAREPVGMSIGYDPERGTYIDITGFRSLRKKDKE